MLGNGALVGSMIDSDKIGSLDTNGVNGIHTKDVKTTNVGMSMRHVVSSVLSPSAGCLLVGDRQSGKTTIARAAAWHFQQVMHLSFMQVYIVYPLINPLNTSDTPSDKRTDNI